MAKFLKLDEGIWDHVLSGDMDHVAFLVWCFMSKEADWKTGVWMGTNPKIANNLPSLTIEQVKGATLRLLKGKYLRRMDTIKRGSDKPRVYLINKFIKTVRTQNLMGNLMTYRLNAWESTGCKPHELVWELDVELDENLIELDRTAQNLIDQKPTSGAADFCSVEGRCIEVRQNQSDKPGVSGLESRVFEPTNYNPKDTPDTPKDFQKWTTEQKTRWYADRDNYKATVSNQATPAPSPARKPIRIASAGNGFDPLTFAEDVTTKNNVLYPAAEVRRVLDWHFKKSPRDYWRGPEGNISSKQRLATAIDKMNEDVPVHFGKTANPGAKKYTCSADVEVEVERLFRELPACTVCKGTGYVKGTFTNEADCPTCRAVKNKLAEQLNKVESR